MAKISWTCSKSIIATMDLSIIVENCSLIIQKKILTLNCCHLIRFWKMDFEWQNSKGNQILKLSLVILAIKEKNISSITFWFQQVLISMWINQLLLPGLLDFIWILWYFQVLTPILINLGKTILSLATERLNCRQNGSINRYLVYR